MDPILYWNDVALEANRLSHTLPGGEQTGPTLSSRALAIVHLAIHDAYFGVHPSQAAAQDHGLYMPAPGGVTPGTNAAAAVAGAAEAALAALYPSRRHAFAEAVRRAAIPAASAEVGRAYGQAVAAAVVAALAIKPGEIGNAASGYAPSMKPGRHRPDPDNPNQGFDGPFYGSTVRDIAVTGPHQLDDPPSPSREQAKYEEAYDEVRAKGARQSHAPITRTAAETLIGTFWAYDGARGIGTPPRLYNQMVRAVGRPGGGERAAAQNARLLALVNAAMGDAGKYAWLEKYRHDLWRPVLGVRERDPSTGPSAAAGRHGDGKADPFWLPLGAPRSNTTDKSFTPNFPAYPSGHATFGAAAFQMVRLFHNQAGTSARRDKPDTLAFEFVSDELNGSTTDSAGTVRVRHVRRFESLWQAILENGLSRVFLGVHWRFDAFSAGDVPVGTKPEEAEDISYPTNVGGVPLGLAIANDIFTDKLVFKP